MAVEKKTLRLGMIGILLTSILISFAVAIDRGRIRTETEALVLENDVKYVIDSVLIAEDVKIQGWAMVLGEEINIADCNVMLVGEESKEVLILPTMIVERADLTEVFQDGTDYTKAGFLANIAKDRLSLEKEDYRIYLEYLTNRRRDLVATDKKVSAVRETTWQETDTSEADISYVLDNATVKSKVLTINGWLFRKGDAGKETKTEVLLLSSRTQKAYVLPTEIVVRMDLKQIFPGNGSLEHAGFTTSMETWRFDFGYDQFEICLRYTNGSEIYTIHTGEYVNLEEQEEK